MILMEMSEIPTKMSEAARLRRKMLGMEILECRPLCALLSFFKIMTTSVRFRMQVNTDKVVLPYLKIKSCNSMLAGSAQFFKAKNRDATVKEDITRQYLPKISGNLEFTQPNLCFIS